MSFAKAEKKVRDGEMAREQGKSRVMDVMHSDFFFNVFPI